MLSALLTLQALTALGFSKAKQAQLMGLVLGVCAIGNVTFGALGTQAAAAAGAGGLGGRQRLDSMDAICDTGEALEDAAKAPRRAHVQPTSQTTSALSSLPSLRRCT